MYKPLRPLLPITVRQLYREIDVRLTPAQLAESLCHSVSEITRLGILPGPDGKIGPSEMLTWPAN